jgi:hypothetical protein
MNVVLSSTTTLGEEDGTRPQDHSDETSTMWGSDNTLALVSAIDVGGRDKRCARLKVCLDAWDGTRQVFSSCLTLVYGLTPSGPSHSFTWRRPGLHQLMQLSTSVRYSVLEQSRGEQESTTGGNARYCLHRSNFRSSSRLPGPVCAGVIHLRHCDLTGSSEHSHLPHMLVVFTLFMSLLSLTFKMSTSAMST